MNSKKLALKKLRLGWQTKVKILDNEVLEHKIFSFPVLIDAGQNTKIVNCVFRKGVRIRGGPWGMSRCRIVGNMDLVGGTDLNFI